MKQRVIQIFVATTVAAVTVAATEVGPSVTQSIQRAVSREHVSRQQVESGAELSVKNGNEAFFRGAYQQAIKHYLDAIKVLRTFGGDEGAMKDKIRRCREQIAQSYYYIAQDLVLKADNLAHAKDYEEAIKNCKEAISYYPEGEEEIKKRIVEYEKVRDHLLNRDLVTTEELLPDQQERSYKIDVLLQQAFALYTAGLFDQAQKKYESVLVSDPYNVKALRGLEASNIRMGNASWDRFKNVHRERMAEVAWKFAIPILPEDYTSNKKVADTVISKATGGDNELQEKLRSIVIPRIDFEDISVPTAIKYLREQSKINDPKREGINIHLLQLPPTAAQIAARQAAIDAAKAARKNAEDSEEETGEDTAKGEVKFEDPNQVINLILTKKTIGEAIHYLCNAAKLKSRIDKNVVIIAPESVELDEIKWRVYPIEAASLAGLEGGGTDPEVLKKHFLERGVRFPTGSVIVYKPRFSRIVATNTEENLRKINEIIQNELTARDPMVQIQARIVEIEQNDFNELTFNYSLSRTETTPPGGTPQPGKLEFNSDDKSIVTGQGAPKLIDISGTDSNGWSYGFSINAVNQLDSKDVLSSPRVTTLNGQLATIRMLTEVYFVDDYDDPQTSVSTNSSGSTTGISTSTYTYVGAFPNFDGDPKELGVSLPVIPRVDIDARTIRLEFSPTIQSFVGWSSYIYKESLNGLESTVELRKPIIAARRVKTSISLYDGETIVIGGVLKDVTTEQLNKVPFIGDIPGVGRLFQSRSSKSQKTNLLIFLTCRLVKPDGTPFSPDSVRPRGVPTFGRSY